MRRPQRWTSRSKSRTRPGCTNRRRNDLQPPEELDLDGWDLHRAATENRADIAGLLVNSGADTEARDENGCTALHIAAWENSLNVARLLIEHGAQVDARDEDDDTPLHITAWKNSVDVAKLLIEQGADVNAKDESGRTPADTASTENYPYPQAVEVARLLAQTTRNS